MQRLAVIDLGTNTFHLLIVEKGTDGFKEVLRKRIHVFLAEDGIQAIGEKAYQRAIRALEQIKHLLDDYKVDNVKAIGTAALRRASNADKFVLEVHHRLGIKIDVIDGMKEAFLIFKGINYGLKSDLENFLIMDIGGGSVEFVLIQNGKMSWSKSYDVGVAILYKKFHTQDPISQVAMEQLDRFLHESFCDFKAQMNEKKIPTLVGASGSFEVLESIARAQGLEGPVTSDVLNQIGRLIIQSSYEERLRISGLEEARAELIVVSVLLMKWIVEWLDIETILVSPYAVKEGVLLEMLQI